LGDFINILSGHVVYNIFKEINQCFDPHLIFNPGKIVDTPPMDSCLRYVPAKEKFVTVFDYASSLGLLRAIEQCNGAGDCRKWHTAGGTMCPSYMATRDECNSTRARANLLREYITFSDENISFAAREVYDNLNLCLSCKGCKSECPSNVDMAKLKAEFLQHYYDTVLHGRVPFRTWMIAHINTFNRLGSIFPLIFNLLANSRITKSILGFDLRRNIPKIGNSTLRNWVKRHTASLNEQLKHPVGSVVFFIDEFSNYHDVGLGKKAILLLHHLGYRVETVSHKESGRAYISKGLLRKARKIADENVDLLSRFVSADRPLVGVEPSCILSFRDEYPELVTEGLREKAKILAAHTFTIEEFIVREFKQGNISADSFTDAPRKVFFHGHCQQKSLITTQATREMLAIPVNYTVSELKTGCCGMAGSFGYEKEHYDLSMQIGELALFPQVRELQADSIVAAPGTSCRQHIAHGTGRIAVHPIEALYEAVHELH
ncbi:MAG: 4Fe-4S dicluster domain-containing protein, partial [Bacteroidales bacterium]|nr:4Fe-4S dicluster domain-containing protein [Bacteroidales bacterium]